MTSESSTRIIATIKTNKADSASIENDSITFLVLNGRTPVGGGDTGADGGVNFKLPLQLAREAVSLLLPDGPLTAS